MKEVLMGIKKRLYIYVLVDLLLVLLAGYFVDFHRLNIKPIGMLAVFIMLYPMLTGMETEKVKKSQ